MDAVKSTPGQRLARSISAPRAGQIIGGRYQLEEWLESGAMGNVWRAQQVRLRSRAAIKFLDPSLIEVPEMLERFLQEARSAAAVQSAHVIQVFDYGSEGGLPYIAMELLHGENLEARLARRGVLSPAELDKIFSEVARGLGQAHAMGVIHRDVKPGNIFLVREGQHEVTKLIDFGIAKVKADALRVSQVVGTQLGAFLGTPQYMSPEQMRGRSTVDCRTDLWALAIIAFECLVGRCPFSATTIGDLTVQICMEKPLAPSTLADVPAGFDEWFFKGTHKEPRDRFASAEEMADALTKVLLPGGRARASDPRSAPLVSPNALAVPGGWSAISRRLVRLSALVFDRACAQGATSAARLRTTARGVSKTVAEALSRPAGSRSGRVGLALLVVACGLLLFRAERRSRPAAASADSTSHALVAPAVLPVMPRPAVPATPSAPPPDPGTPPALRELPRSPVTAARSTSAKTRKARRRGKRHGRPASSVRSAAPVPSTPMSSDMMRLSEVLAKGRNRQPAPATDAASVQTRDRASSETD
jgi:tRNA A-37 threonylcarbamoyl transferase component Bud32